MIIIQSYFEQRKFNCSVYTPIIALKNHLVSLSICFLLFNFLVSMTARRLILIVLVSLLGRSCKAARSLIISSRCWFDIAYIPSIYFRINRRVPGTIFVNSCARSGWTFPKALLSNFALSLDVFHVARVWPP